MDNKLFDWICNRIDNEEHTNLLQTLYNEPFVAVMEEDENRIRDGIYLRYIFSEECRIPKRIIDIELRNDSCSVLEMILGLAIRIEDTIMSDSDYGDRTSMWFWLMIKSMGLHEETDFDYNYEYVDMTINKFINREYKYNGYGSLFTLQDTLQDMRDLEIWYQMCLFFDSIL